MKHLRVNDHDMAYIEVGQGSPLVCIHGSLGDFRTWSSVLGPLSRKHRVIAPSLRHFFPEHWDGVGGHYTIAQHVDDVGEFIAGLGLGPVDLIGHSRGGHIAFRVAQHRPELVRKLILAEPGGELDASLSPAWNAAASQARSARFAAAAAKVAAGRVDEALGPFIDSLDGEGAWARLDASEKQQHRDNALTLLGQVNEHRPPFSLDDARSVAAATLLIGGSKTGGTFPAIMRALAESMPCARIELIPDTSHHMIRQDPVRTSRAILDFLAGS